MITADQLREAIDVFRRNELEDMWDEFNREVLALWEEVARDFLSKFDPADYDSLSGLAKSFCETATSHIEYELSYGELPLAWSQYNMLHWHNDKYSDYYESNREECDDCFHQVDLDTCDSIQSIVNETVKVAYHEKAESELYKAMITIEYGEQTLVEYLRQKRT